MRFILEVECGNAAFEDEPLAEISRILDDQARKMRRWVGDGQSTWQDTLRDENGNVVGRAAIVRSSE